MANVSTSHAHLPLPGILQASFAVESEGFAWWGVDDPAKSADALVLPAGDQTSVTMALPDSPASRAPESAAAVRFWRC